MKERETEHIKSLSIAPPAGTVNPLQGDGTAESLEEGGTRNVLHEGGEPRPSRTSRASKTRRSSAHRDTIPDDSGMAPRRASAVIRDSIPDEEAARRAKITTSGRNRGSFYQKEVDTEESTGANDEEL